MAGRKKEKAEAAGVKAPRIGAPTQEQIRQRAYAIFLARGGGPGQEVEDWLQAERELRARRSPAT